MYIAVDVGGTNIRIEAAQSLADMKTMTLPEKRRVSGDFTNDIQFIFDSIFELAEGQAVEAIAIGTPGDLSADKSMLVRATNLSYWENEPIVEMLTTRFDCPVYHDNDALVAGWAEAVYGDGRNFTDFDFIVWGTGVGGARYKKDDSGDFGATMYTWQDLEEHDQFVSGASLVRSFAKSTHDFSDDEWARAEQMFVDAISRHIDSQLSEHVILGGGMTFHRVDSLREKLSTFPVSVTISSLGPNIGLIGGFALLKQSLNS